MEEQRQAKVEAATALMESRREFWSLLDILAGTFYRCEVSSPWRMTFVSEGGKALTGFDLETIKTLGWERLMHPDDVAGVEAQVASAVANKWPFSVTYRLRHQSGELRWVREQGQAVFGANGEALYLEGMIADVTEEEKLRQRSAAAQSEALGYAARLAQVLESTTDCVFVLNSDWQLIYLNKRAQEELSSTEDLVGRHILDAFPQLEKTPFWDAYREVMSERKPRQIEAFLPGLDHWYDVHAAPIDDGITIFFRNIDGRKQAEEALRERESQLRNTLDHIPQMVWSTRADGYHDYYSGLWYEFTGMPVGSTDGAGWSNMFHPDDQERAWDVWRHSLRTGAPYEIEYRLRHHSGEYRWVLGRAWQQKDANGKSVRWYGTCTDIHERVCAQNALYESRTLQQSVLEASADCIQILLPDGTIEFINEPGMRAMDLASMESVLEQKWDSFWPPEGRGLVQQAIEDALSDRSARFTGFCPTVTGNPKWLDVVITPIKDEAGKVRRLLSIARDITVQRQTAQQLKWTSEHDSLTNLPNRRAFEAHLHAAAIRTMQSGGEMALLLLDLDHFKHVNDTLGHAAGDHLLTVFARRLRETLSPDDFVARLGGDEFAVILEAPQGDLDPLRVGAELVSRVQQPVRFESRYLRAGASIGGAVFPADADNAHELLKNADIALYALKDSGRGGTQMFHSHMREHAQLVASQLRMARVALSETSVEPHYQQKVELETGRITGLEALLRWRHAVRGLQFPDTVSEAFKDYELATKIGDLMQRKVFGDLRGWLDRGLDVGFVAINAAPAEFLRDDFAKRLLGRLQEYSIPAAMVEVEITEHVFLQQGADYVAGALRLLNEAGVKIALDDFGTGHSSLTHLRDYPVDVVKIDRSFVQKMTSDREVRAIVSAVVDLARSLKIDVVAEGIENKQQAHMLIEEKCPLGQGFYFGRPVGADKIPELLEASKRRLVA
jgi:diguanylate cyclase (GGDEF)-like protein/PAS domain S-box-containing protein|tara:strand:+ start:54723 stop:57587 length:2865 start_codon:yes stop_codon:yes gene_type:complete